MDRAISRSAELLEGDREWVSSTRRALKASGELLRERAAAL
jgi:hypothetical protein